MYRVNLATPRPHALRIAVGSVILGEAVVFAGLMSVHGVPLRIPSATAFLLAAAIGALLVGGSGALASALRCVREERGSAAITRLLLAGAAGFIALALEIICARTTAMRDSIALVIAGLHSAHIAAGIALATWVFALLHGRRVHRHHLEVLSLVAAYWYFVAGVWMFVWPLVTSACP